MKAIILAAGTGTRMKSDLPKVLHAAAGKPMLHYVVDACFKAGIDDVTVVIGSGGELVKEAIDRPVNFAWQHEQLGTGHAVLCAKEYIDPDDRVVVLYGDTPLITPGFLNDLSDFQIKEEAHGMVVATRVPDPTGYGRVITTASGGFTAIVEHRDLASDQHSINLINTGVYMSTGKELLYGLERLDNNNSPKEYYLTDIPKIVQEDGFKIAVYDAHDYLQFLGVNSQKQLAEATAALRSRIIDRHFENGVVITDPSTVYIDADVEIETGVILHPGVMLYGKCRIDKGAIIGPYTQITDSQIGPGSIVRNSLLEGAQIGADCQIGPFAYLRGGAIIGDRCRIGDFVELKNSTLGNDTKAAHLAYIGDAQVGDRVNFGCGAVTVNYDGTKKHLTVIEDDVFIGSNVNLVAPVEVRTGAFVAAGSTITHEVPADALAIARERQTIKEGMAKKLKKGHKK